MIGDQCDCQAPDAMVVKRKQVFFPDFDDPLGQKSIFEKYQEADWELLAIARQVMGRQAWTEWRARWRAMSLEERKEFAKGEVKE